MRETTKNNEVPTPQNQQPSVEYYTEVRGGVCYNIRELWNYRPATQEQLKAFLFSDSERFSVFVKNEIPDL
jgi:hypothetical protein